jgi:hypothetical protein
MGIPFARRTVFVALVSVVFGSIVLCQCPGVSGLSNVRSARRWPLDS